MFDFKEAEILAGKIYSLLKLLKFCRSHKEDFQENLAIDYLIEHLCKLSDKLNVKFIENEN